jgi:regulator of PEP synthase PpsR (kinase-PPPase family)
MDDSRAHNIKTHSSSPTIFIISGGVGASGEHLVYTVLAQFPGNNVRIITIGNVTKSEQVSDALKRANDVGGLVTYTLVDARLRNQLLAEAQGMGIPAIDLMGPLIGWLSIALNQEPLESPGKYRELHREYFDRVAAIEYTLTHDDGKHREGWSQAEIVLVGISRSGKTPLSVYLAVLGWKVANIPLVPQIPVPEELFALEPNRVIGLTIDPEQLLVFRRQRQSRLGIKESSTYTDLETIEEEIQAAKKVYRRGNFQIVNMTDKTIEQGADEIIRKLAGQTSSNWV